MPETLFMIHGMFTDVWCWKNFRDFFTERGFKCITPTLCFHDADPSASPPPQLGTLSLVDYADDLEREIKNTGDVPIIIGHSMGGLLAQILGSRGLAKALILLNPAAPRGILALKPSVIRGFWSGMTTWGFWRKPIRPTFREAAYSMLNLLSFEEQTEIYSKFVHESGRAASEIGFWIFDSKKASEIDAVKITCPVLVVGSSHDRITPVSLVRKVAEKYAHLADYKEFPNHAHWILGEPGWENCAEYCLDWLKEKIK